ncbi:MAG: hypothetical protein ABFS30_16465, partial [Pseudomonadota bacterium]
IAAMTGDLPPAVDAGLFVVASNYPDDLKGKPQYVIKKAREEAKRMADEIVSRPCPKPAEQE